MPDGSISYDWSLLLDPFMSETRTLTAEQIKELKIKLLTTKGFRTSEIKRIARTYDVTPIEIRKALRGILKTLTDEEAAILR